MTEKTTANSPNGSSSSDSSSTPTMPNRDAAALALKSKVVEGAREVTDEVKHLASDVAGEAKKTAASSLSATKNRAAGGLESVAKAIRKTGEQLRAEDDGPFTEYLDRAARQVDVASDYLQRRTVGQLIGDVEHFARREPALFLGGAFVAGLVGGRFLKSSRSGVRQLGAGGEGRGDEGRHNRTQSSGDARRAHEPDPNGTANRQQPNGHDDRPNHEPPSGSAASGTSGPKAKRASEGSNKAPGAT